MNIYFICTGNTCRSPMAAAILMNKHIPNVEVRSAGIYAQSGSIMSINAQHVLNQQNIKHSHSSALFNEQDAQWADLILTMTAAHKELVLHLVNNIEHKTFTLNEYVAQDVRDIQDPYGGNITVYEQTFEQLNEAIEKLETKIRLGEHQ
ncbi:low molecular weight protein arginine phosphatase [Solibacillus sp. MA9]|uniref:Low molecular weight protein arginine phosphatase n=1 Tax=Solibacillus palustris TaxID=2908203 RepID=A0ABS9U9B7_9BACL|nr:low molecular weight protein arginine phosphatase [Solibacillus sp. MA9]MCH7320558.1 low molecular weight protein arginine phosphatase [Solibacillus sp. MA9]